MFPEIPAIVSDCSILFPLIVEVSTALFFSVVPLNDFIKQLLLPDVQSAIVPWMPRTVVFARMLLALGALEMAEMCAGPGKAVLMSQLAISLTVPWIPIMFKLLSILLELIVDVSTALLMLVVPIRRHCQLRMSVGNL